MNIYYANIKSKPDAETLKLINNSDAACFTCEFGSLSEKTIFELVKGETKALKPARTIRGFFPQWLRKDISVPIFIQHGQNLYLIHWNRTLKTAFYCALCTMDINEMLDKHFAFTWVYGTGGEK